jgi:hypothetical protein
MSGVLRFPPHSIVNPNGSEMLAKMQNSDTVLRLRSHHPLRGTRERAEMAKLIGDARAGLVELKAAMVFLELQYTDLTAQIGVHESLLAPIQNLPDEVLLMVFFFYRGSSYCVRGQVTDGYRPRHTLTSPGGKHPLLVLTSVCAHWRDLALSSSRLWSSVHIDLAILDGLGRHNRKIVKTRIDTFISRAANSLLDLHVLAYLSKFRSREGPEILERIFRCTERWNSVELVLGEAITATVAASLRLDANRTPLPFPNLQHLHFDALFPRDLTGLNRSLFMDSPKLKSLVLNNGAAKCFQFPFRQLETLDILFQDARYLDRIASPIHFKTLYLTINMYSHSLRRYTIHTIKCDDLELDINSEQSFKQLLAMTRFADIKRLTICSGKFSTDPIASSFPMKEFRTSFSQQTLCQLTTFTLHRVGISEGELLSLLPLMPSLEAFLMSEDWECPPPEGRPLIGEAFFRALDASRHAFRSDPILPSLKKLYLAITTPFNEEAMLAMVRSRWWPVSLSMVAHASEEAREGEGGRVDRNPGKICASLDSFEFYSLRHRFGKVSEAMVNFEKLRRNGFRLHVQDQNGMRVSF